MVEVERGCYHLFHCSPVIPKRGQKVHRTHCWHSVWGCLMIHCSRGALAVRVVNPSLLVSEPEWVQEPAQVPVLEQVWAVQVPELVWEVAVECQGQGVDSIPDKG